MYDGVKAMIDAEKALKPVEEVKEEKQEIVEAPAEQVEVLVNNNGNSEDIVEEKQDQVKVDEVENAVDQNADQGVTNE